MDSLMRQLAKKMHLAPHPVASTTGVFSAANSCKLTSVTGKEVELASGGDVEGHQSVNQILIQCLKGINMMSD